MSQMLTCFFFILAKPIRAGGGHLVGGGTPGVVRPAPAQDIKRKSIIVGARGEIFTFQCNSV